MQNLSKIMHRLRLHHFHTLRCLQKHLELASQPTHTLLDKLATPVQTPRSVGQMPQGPGAIMHNSCASLCQNNCFCRGECCTDICQPRLPMSPDHSSLRAHRQHRLGSCTCSSTPYSSGAAGQAATQIPLANQLPGSCSPNPHTAVSPAADQVVAVRCRSQACDGPPVTVCQGLNLNTPQRHNATKTSVSICKVQQLSV